MRNLTEFIVDNRVQVIAIICNLTFFYFVINLVRRKKIKEEYSILWFFFCVVFLVFSFWREGLEVLASWLGIYYAPMAFLLILILGILSILIHFSVVISTMSEQNKSLVQELGILKSEVKQLVEQGRRDTGSGK